jgi:type VI secretion system protein ImpM
MHHQAPGWYGKLSMLGDFASRRLDAGWIARIHAWIAAGLLASRERLGERWPQAYLGAPLWRFAWAPGIVDTRWWFGVLMPSCDSVGRYYPLVVVEARARPPSDRIGLDHLDLWWQRLAQATLATLAARAAPAGASRSCCRSPAPPGSARHAADATRARAGGCRAGSAAGRQQHLVAARGRIGGRCRGATRPVHGHARPALRSHLRRAAHGHPVTGLSPALPRSCRP